MVTAITHDSHSVFFRQPFGARQVGESVYLALTIKGRQPLEVSLRFWDGNEHIFKMSKKQTQTGNTYSATVSMPVSPCSVWYYFIVKFADKVVFYGNNKEELGGLGNVYDHEPPGYQITVYEAKHMPKWLRGGMIYQIFPDRFYNPYDKPLASKPDSLWHDDWYREPLYARDRQTGAILAYDFFGGNLDGITAKLDYLQDFGVTVIYLNPIFLSVSNHRFDTGDYECIDPVLGDDAAFKRLCSEAKKRGMYVILDGVFSHTGSDSRYFNKEGSYGELGAYQSKESKYYKWYNFKKYPDDYESWWGIGNLPNVNELDRDYLDYIIEAERSIIARWLRAGAKGWRLDVADELPEEFIKRLRLRMKREDAESYLLGEVWEDASRKSAYGSLRNYFLGDQLDAVMNYPFKSCVLDFLLGKRTSGQVMRELYSLYENYPKENFELLMNLLGTHDTVRLLTELSQVDGSGFSDTQKRKFKLGGEQKQAALKRLNLAVIWQMTFAGLPSVYYGDEAGMEGFADPFNRGTYPWGQEDEYVYSCHWHMSRVRRRYEVLRKGSWQPLPCESDILSYARYHESSSAIVALNRSAEAKTFSADSREALADILSGEVFVPQEGCLSLTLKGGQGRILHKRVKYPDRLRKAGVLLHITSLPSAFGIGDFGSECYKFIDFLAQSQHTLWQILPLNPVDNFGSPYAGSSAFAGNTLLIAPELLLQRGLLTQEELDGARVTGDSSDIDYAKVRTDKEKLFQKAYRRFKPDDGFIKFCANNSDWLEDYSLYAALQAHFEQAWYEWPDAVKNRDGDELAKWRQKYAEEINYHKFLQYEFWRQWSLVREKANQKGIVIIGDIPIYVAYDSADAWAHQELFELDGSGSPKAVAGVPPDYFSKTGQLWGNALYNWAACKKEGYVWWKRRFEQGLKAANILRLDHFRGFESYWSVPYGMPTAAEGAWQNGPAEDFFLAMQKYFDGLPFIAEDLGEITPAVNRLRDRFDLPGMDILQFGLSGNIRKLLYTGTHDNDTLLGFVKSHENDAQFAHLTGGADLSGGLSPAQTVDKLLKFVYMSDYIWVITPLQDLLGLDSTARMNTPSTCEDNWRWRFEPDALDGNVIAKAKELAAIGARAGQKNIDEIIPGM